MAHFGTIEQWRQPDEQSLFTERLHSLEAEAAAGQYAGGESVRFLASSEIEFELATPAAIEASWQGKEEAWLREQRTRIYPVDNPVHHGPNKEVQQAAILRAVEFLTAFVPQTTEERARQIQWLNNLWDFDARHIVNFCLYEEFSRPMFGDPAPAPGLPYNDMATRSSDEDPTTWLEFRFGTLPYQEGYEDNPGVSEIRLTPCPPAEAARRRAIIMERAASIADEQGFLMCNISEHLNVGIYITDEQGVGRPVISRSLGAVNQTLDAVSGIGAAFQDGLWLGSRAVEQPVLFREGVIDNLGIGPTRTKLRIVEDHVELRHDNLFRNFEHGLAWVMAGALEGLEQGGHNLAAAGYEVPDIRPLMRVERDETFQKRTDVHIQRALERSVINEDGWMILDPGYADRRFTQITAALLQIPEVVPVPEADVLPEFVIASIEVAPDGQLACSAERMRLLYEARVEDDSRADLARYAADFDTFAAQMTGRFRCIRVREVESIQGVATWRARSPEATGQALAHSRIGSIMLGGYQQAYAAWIADRARVAVGRST